nr:hypothetical protein [uncultured Anaerosporobacter sp.]
MAVKKYTDYDYESIYNKELLGEESIEEAIEQIKKSGKDYGYVVKTIQSGEMLESEVYPLYRKRKQIPKRDKEKTKASRDAQIKLNWKNSVKYAVRLINTNFKRNDYFVTLTYKDGDLPSEERAKKDMKNYIKKLRRYIKKEDLEAIKYMYAIEFVGEDERGHTRKVRIHHHMIMNAVIPREVVEDLWGKGRADCKRLQPDEFGLEGVARYITKRCNLHRNNSKDKSQEEEIRKFEKSWISSKNLKKPTINKSTTKLTRRKAENMAKNQNQLKELFEKLYSNKYTYNDSTTYISDITGGFYLYARMRKKC